MVFKIDNDPGNTKKQSIQVEACGMKAEIEEDPNESFIAAMKESKSCRFGVVDNNNKLLFVSWVPDSSKAKDRMVYASVKEAFISSLQGINAKIQCTDDGELSKEAICENAKSNV